MHRSRVCLLFLMAAWMFLGGCATTSTTTSRAAPDPNILRVGIAADLAPMAFKSGTEFRGLEPDLARALAADLGRRVDFVEVRWDGLIDALLSGKVDIIMSGMTITEARLMRVNFSKPYLRVGQTILARRSNADRLRATLFESKTRVGAQKGTTGDLWAKEYCSNCDRKLYRTAALGAKALLDGRIDAFICDAPVNWWLASENEAAGLAVVSGYLTQEYLAWAIRKEDTKLLEAANRFIDEGRKSGSLDSIVRKWIPLQ